MAADLQTLGSVYIDIHVLDANDNNPIFNSSTYETEVFENQPPMTILLQVGATDPDLGPNGHVVYGLADQSEKLYGNVFGVEPETGILYIKQGLDYEQVRTFQLGVTATDSGTGTLPVFAKVTVLVRDVNDNPPQITLNVLTTSGKAEVTENVHSGMFVAHIAVRDFDEGRNGEVDCSIDDDVNFRLEALYHSEYKITTGRSFDREECDHYEFIISCRDRGLPALESSRTIEVIIVDDNDHDPSFQSDHFDVQLPENTPFNSTIAKLNASDDDIGKNRAILYRLLRSLDETPETVLSVDLITGSVTTCFVFDYEQKREYAFLVTAADQGDPPRSTSAILLVHVTDVNDKWPVFDQLTYRFTVSENSEIGTSIGRVNATDRDLSPQFNQVNYGFVSPAIDVFHIDKHSGELTTAARLDREAQAEYRFQVSAFNIAEHGTSGTRIETRVNVTVVVGDVNDNPPVFLFPNSLVSSVEISGKMAAFAGSFVARLVATDADADENAELVYEILNGNEEELFEIEPNTGIISTARPLIGVQPTPETVVPRKVHHLIVRVKDCGLPSKAVVADLSVLVNTSLQPNYAAQAANSMSLFEGANMAIMIGALLGGVLTITCLILGVVCACKLRRTPASSVDGKQLQQSLQTGMSVRSVNTLDSRNSFSNLRSHGSTRSCSDCRCHRNGGGGGDVRPVDCSSITNESNADDDVDDDDDLDDIDGIPPNRPLQSNDSRLHSADSRPIDVSVRLYIMTFYYMHRTSFIHSYEYKL